MTNSGDKKRVWLIGAGATISHTNGNFPSIRQFFQFSKRLGITMETRNSIKEEYKPLEEYIWNVLGKNIKRLYADVDIEKVLTLIQIDQMKHSYGYLRNVNDLIMHVVRAVIHGAQMQVASNGGDYLTLANTVSPSDTLITFNWDTLLDDSFGRESYLKDRNTWKDREDQYLNFLFHLSALKETTIMHASIEPPHTSIDSGRGFYLKLHGSVDWQYCPNRTCRAYNKAFPVNDYETKHFCSECYGAVQPLLIPPVLNKQYEDYSIIQTVWNTAQREVATAQEIIIWGYSLPPTDFHANWLLRQAQPGIQRLSIIDPNVVRIRETSTLNFAFIRHLLDPLRHKMSVKEICLYESYSDYSNGILANEKHAIEGIVRV